MKAKLKVPKIHSPRSLGELVNLYKKMPDSLLYAGGTGILWNQRYRTLNLPSRVLSLGEVSELNFISRTESYLEIGSTAPLNRILGIGRHVIAPALYEGIEGIATPVIRNQATFGGNLAQRESWMDLMPVLLLLEVRLEVIRQGGSIWLPMGKFLERDPLFGEGELIARLRIPFEEWNVQFFRKFEGPQYGWENRLSMAALAQVQKGFVSRWRFALGVHSGRIIRSREMETLVEGKKLPLSDRDLAPLEDLIKSIIDQVQPPMTTIQKALVHRGILWFLQRRLGEVGG